MSDAHQKHRGLQISTIPSQSDEPIKSAFRQFLNQPKSYTNQYLQKKFTEAFDGYSYMGQKDSSNQYDTDLLHSFVLSSLSEKASFPTEFRSFFSNNWNDLIRKVRQIELEVIQELAIPGLEVFYNTEMVHMISCNYYPAINQINKKLRVDTRLSSHKDVSLFSVFLFGIDNGLSYEDESGIQKNLGPQTQVVLFPGYFLELISEGKYKAVAHQVELPKDNAERFSFAFFSIPKPSSNIQFGDIHLTGKEYYQQYLSLF